MVQTKVFGQKKLAQYTTSAPTTPFNLIVPTYTTSDTSTTTTSSGTLSIPTNMTLYPASGTYIATFSANMYTGGASAQGEFGIYVNGSLVSETRREIKCNLSLLGGLVTISLNTIGIGTSTTTQINVNQNDVITVQFKSNNGGTIGLSEKVLTLIKVK